tara:strand:+ start:515 stop:709 length:195 start_codon:yes stop_codon:yes gene_type:complete
MGLDGVELVMAFEESFELAIPNKDAAGLQTIGHVTTWVCDYLELHGRPQNRQLVFETVCKITRE